MKPNWKVLLIVVLSWLTLTGWAKPAVYDLVGQWEGTVEVGKFKIRVRLKFAQEAGGRVKGTMDVVDQGARDLPIAAVLYNEPDVRLEFDMMEMAFTGSVSADRNQFVGSFDEGPGGKPIEVKFRRLTEAETAEVAKSYTFKPGESHDLRGYWKLLLQPAKEVTLRIGLRIGRLPNGTFEALMDSLDQGAKDIPANVLDLKGRQVRFEWQALQVTFDAELDGAGDRLAGQWKQGGGKPLSVTAERIAQPLTALPDNLSFEPEAGALEDPRGRWNGALSLPDQSLRLALKIGRAADGSYAGLLISVDQGGAEIPATSAVLTNHVLRLDWKHIRASYTGGFTNAGRALTGQWEQGGPPLPLTFSRDGHQPGAEKPAAQ